MIKNESIGRKIFVIINYLLLFSIAMVCVMPFLHVIGTSFASSTEILKRPFIIIPKRPTLTTYEYIFTTKTLMNSLNVSIIVTVLGTLMSMVMTVLTAFPLAHRDLIGHKIMMNGVIFTLLFSGGMIPGFMLVRNLGMIDSLAALIIPGCISTYNLIIIKNFFQQLPAELEQSAKIDGCNDVMILFKIILPLSLPVLATFSLFYAVGYWNNYFSCLLYINDSSKWNVQILLRQIVLMSSGIGDQDLMAGENAVVIPAEGVKMATIVVSTLPILLMYPFLQRYFTSGILLGSIKG